MLPEVRAEGKGDSVRNGLEEAGWHTCGPTNRNRMIRLSLRASWHDTTKPKGSRSQGKCGGGARKVHVLIRGDLSDERQVRMVSVIIRNPEAPCVATHRVSGQKSAEGIGGRKTEGPNVEVRGGLP